MQLGWHTTRKKRVTIKNATKIEKEKRAIKLKYYYYFNGLS